MLTEKKETMGALLVCLAATLWGFDSIVLTPNLFKLSVPYVVFMVHLLPFVGMTLLFGKEELKNIKKLDGKDLTYFFLVALFGGSLGTLSIVKALFLVNFDHLTVVTLLQKLLHFQRKKQLIESIHKLKAYFHCMPFEEC